VTRRVCSSTSARSRTTPSRSSQRSNLRRSPASELWSRAGFDSGEQPDLEVMRAVLEARSTCQLNSSGATFATAGRMVGWPLLRSRRRRREPFGPRDAALTLNTIRALSTLSASLSGCRFPHLAVGNAVHPQPLVCSCQAFPGGPASLAIIRPPVLLGAKDFRPDTAPRIPAARPSPSTGLTDCGTRASADAAQPSNFPHRSRGQESSKRAGRW
jgi:hypothetical protein